MLVYKFGGASVKNAEAVKNLYNIVKNSTQNLVVVISAMGKTTNSLERLVTLYFKKNSKWKDSFKEIKSFHFEIVGELFADKDDAGIQDIQHRFDQLEERLSQDPSLNFNFEYDQIVSYGEIFSTVIVNAYLNKVGLASKWIDIRRCLKTDNHYREAQINFELSQQLVKDSFSFKDSKIYVTQGFIGSNENNLTTTLGREGSDYTAAVLAFLLNLKHVTIWKDVPGVLNADPKWFDDTIKLDKISYLDAIELAYYGTSVIHPKTIQPLQHKGIKLNVRSFLNPDDPGTVIGDSSYSKLIPSFIFKMDQVLMQIFPRDFSFIAEDNLVKIFGYFVRHALKINLMQNSAVSFKVCLNNDQSRIPNVIDDLNEHFDVSYENGLELITIRYYDNATIERVLVNKDLLLEQRNKQTIQMVVKDLGSNT
ncbi:MAG: aspartate kinase [Bacteroidales bacterium]|nr:aspartate kinase [Bacteroidales bacterium]